MFYNKIDHQPHSKHPRIQNEDTFLLESSVKSSPRLILIALLLAWALVGCNSDKQGKIEVQVFITTNSGENLRLGNAPIVVMNEQMFQELKTALNGLASRNEVRLKAAIESAVSVIRNGQQLPNVTALPEYQQLRAMAFTGIANYYDYSLHYFHDYITEYPHKFAITYTDADGVASIGVPDKDEKYYVIASSKREVGTKIEKYGWIEIIQPTNGRVVLSNNNLWDMMTRGPAMGFTILPELPQIPEL